MQVLQAFVPSVKGGVVRLQVVDVPSGNESTRKMHPVSANEKTITNAGRSISNWNSDRA
jgi:hypothetical protein